MGTAAFDKLWPDGVPSADRSRIYVKNGHPVIDMAPLDNSGHVPTQRLDQPTNRALGETWDSYQQRVLANRSFSPDTAQVTRLSALEPDVADSANALLRHAAADGVHLTPVETRRTQERQEMLFQKGRSAPGDVATWTLTSDHTPGRAVDFSGGPSALQWLQHNAPTHGFSVMGDMDPGHVSMPAGVSDTQPRIAPPVTASPTAPPAVPRFVADTPPVMPSRQPFYAAAPDVPPSPSRRAVPSRPPVFAAPAGVSNAPVAVTSTPAPFVAPSFSAAVPPTRPTRTTSSAAQPFYAQAPAELPSRQPFVAAVPSVLPSSSRRAVAAPTPASVVSNAAVAATAPPSAFDSLWDSPPTAASEPPSSPGGDRLDALWDGEKPGILSRTATAIGSGITQAVTHPIDTAESLVTTPVKSLITAMSPSVGAARPDARLSKGGNASGRAIDTTPYDAAHGGVTPTERANATAQTVANIALPRFANLGASPVTRVLGTAAGGAAAGAAYNPNDRVVGALSGAALAPASTVAARAGSRLLAGAADVAIDAAGTRPMDSRPMVQLGPVSLGRVEGIADRAARMNANAIGTGASDGLSATSGKPVTPIDVAGTAGVRAARGLKTASPGAETVLRDALQGRTDNAVDRVIQHGLETTGLASRENGLQVVDDMIAQRTQHGNENYQPVFEQYDQPIADPEFAKIAQTPAGAQALKRAGILASNRGEAIGNAPAAATFDPTALSPEKQTMYGKLLAMNGGQVEPTVSAMRALGEIDDTTAPKQIAPTLKQAHYVKLAFDDMLNSAPEPGSGGLGPNNASAIRGLKNRWLAAMDNASPEYKSARQQFADESELIRGAELGRNLWKLHPAEAEKAFKELPQAARDVARRTGFDALSERIENGPTDVERGVAKPRDQKRMRLLFPDDASFSEFKQGLSDEARLHANQQAILGGSNTADKLADMANMAGVTLPDVVRAAATGRWHQLAGRAAAGATRRLMNAGSEAVSVERARQLVAGASGDATARADALARIRSAAPSPAGANVGDDFTSSLANALAQHYRTRLFTLPGPYNQPSGKTR